MDFNYILYPDCILVKGAMKSAIYDLTRNKILFIPNTLYQILFEFNGFPLNILKGIYEGEEDTLNEYLEFLLKHEFLYQSYETPAFEQISTVCKSSALISNIIIDVKEYSNHDYRILIDEIKKVKCSSILLRFYFSIELEKLSEILSYFQPPDILDVRVMMPYSDKVRSKETKNTILSLNILITGIIFFGSPYNKNLEYNGTQIEYIRNLIKDETHCGHIGLENFSVNIKMYIESKNYNNCLYKKISVDSDGNIKNCPSCKKSYGLLGEISFLDVIDNPKFRKLWVIKKDDIEVCKECVFRYACIDCRVYRSCINNIYSKPLKCNYNPYEEDNN